MMQRFFIYFIFSFVFFAVYSCKTSKQITVQPSTGIDARQIFDAVQRTNLKFSTFSAKFTVTFNNGKTEMVLTGLLRIKNDSVIWCTLSPGLGFEAARAILTRDSIKWVNKINSTYQQTDYNLIRSISGISMNYNGLESIFLNRLFAFPFEKNIDIIKKYETSVVDNSYFLRSIKPESENDLIRNKTNKTDSAAQVIYIDQNNYTIQRVNLFDKEKQQTLNIEYSDFRKLKNSERVFPYQINFKAIHEKQIVTLLIKFSLIEIDQKVSFAFKIPENYTKN